MSNIGSFTGTILKNLFSKPATSNYPFQPKEYPERTRGHVEIDMEQCVFCGMCERSCPPGAIKVDRNAGNWTINRFDCIQCGYCAEKCPKKCLKMVPGYPEPMPEKQKETEHKDVAKKYPSADLEQCVFCTLCAKKCPVGALTVDRAEKKWVLDKEKCVSCGLCAGSCPKKCIQMK